MEPGSPESTLRPADPAPANVAPAGLVRRNRGKLIFFGLVAAVVLVAGLWTFATMKFSYSSGERVGFVQKLSKKGWICRTWEGELAMNPVPGSQPQIFPFTVPDEAVARKLAASEGKRVSVTYEEKKGIPTSCFGDTPYWIRDVRVLGGH
jgi:hypothetical protein